MEYVIADVLEYHFPENAKLVIIAHICNNVDKFGAGFAKQVALKYPLAKETYHLASQELGNISLVKVEEYKFICNMIAQDGVGKNKKPIRYDALKECLMKLKNICKKKDIYIVMPKIGTGLAGGDWEIISEIIEETLSPIPVIICLKENQ